MIEREPLIKKRVKYKLEKKKKMTCCDSNYNNKKRWMNPTGNPYIPTLVEHYANICTHGIAILPSIYAAFSLVKYAKTHEQHRSVLIYGFSLFALFTVSTLFHLFSLLSHFQYTF